jgi:hypothetical protein
MTATLRLVMVAAAVYAVDAPWAIRVEIRITRE